MSNLAAWLRLTRISNLPTAWSNILMGAVVAEAREPAGLALLLLAASCLYLGGMVLNDVCDLESDRRERPDRVLPAGLIRLEAARSAAWILLLAGPILAAAAGWIATGGEDGIAAWRPAMTGVLLVAAIVWYNAAARRTVLGPLVMGSCRTLNVLLGMSLHRIDGVAGFGPVHWYIAICIGMFVAGLTWFARTEQRRSDRGQLIAANTVMFVSLAALATFPFLVSAGPGREWAGIAGTGELQPGIRFAALLVVVLVPLGSRLARAIASPGSARVQRAVIAGLLSLIFIDASICFLFRDTVFSLVVACLVVPAAVAGRRVQGT